MFGSVTWTLFFTTVITVAVGYYIISIPLLYSAEIRQWLKATPGRPTPAASEEPFSPGVMGKIKYGDSSVGKRKSSLISEEFRFGPEDEPSDALVTAPHQTSKSDEALIGRMASLLDEVREVIELAKELNSERLEFESALQTVFMRHSQFLELSYRHAISLFVAELSKEIFPGLQPSEISSLWEDKFDSFTNHQ